MGTLVVPEAPEAALERCWAARGRRSLYGSFPQFRELVQQVLSRDIRSVTQRVKVPHRAAAGGPAALCQRTAAQQQQQGGEEGFWKVVLDGIQISYDVAEGGGDVVVRSARLAAVADA